MRAFHSTGDQQVTTRPQGEQGSPSADGDGKAAAASRDLPIPYLGIVGGVLGLAALVFFLLIPTYPSYDGYYSLLWAQELVDGSLPSFQVTAAPTEHPAGILLGVISLIFGDHADRAYVFFGIVSFAALATALYALGAELFNWIIGLLTALLVLTRFDLGALAVRGFVDIPYLALIIWATVLVARQPRRVHGGTFALLTVAGLLRPEAWLFAGIYWLWCLRFLDTGGRIKWALVVGIAPLIWFGVDLIVTGNPLFSLTETRDLAAELGRRRGFFATVTHLPILIARTVKMAVLIAGVAGIGMGLLYWRRRMVVPLAVAAIGLGTFLTTTAAGLAVNLRYLSAVSVIVCLGAGIALGGWTMRDARGRWLPLAVGLLALVLLGARVPSLYKTFEVERAKVIKVHHQNDQLLELLSSERAQAAFARCQTMTVPSHQTVPIARYMLDAPSDQIGASTYQLQAPTEGLVLTANIGLMNVKAGPGGRINWWATQAPESFPRIGATERWQLFDLGCDR